VQHSDDSDHPDWTPPVGRPVRASWLVIGAVLALLLIAVSIYYTAQWYEARSGNRLLVAIATAVADAHRRPRPLEIQSADPRAVLARYPGFDAERLAGRLTGRDEVLLGGWSVPIEGRPFVALRYRAADGRALTRCIGTLPARRNDNLPRRVADTLPPPLLIEGVAVAVWREQDLVFAEAR
jgi:hypothetical protein